MRDYREMIVSNPGVMMGKPVVAGTRITVELILEKLAGGETVEQVVAAGIDGRLVNPLVGAGIRYEGRHRPQRDWEHGRELAGAFAVLSPASIRIRREILP